MDMDEAMISTLKEMVNELGPVEGLLVWEKYVQEVVKLGEVIILLSFDPKGRTR